MSAIEANTAIPSFTIPGITHKTLAGPQHGITGYEVWEQWIEPHQATPVHRHTCQEVIVVFSGRAEVIVNGQRFECGPNSTIRVPADAVHQVNNISGEVMHLVATLGMSPVVARDADGKVMQLPWQ
jgi:mannose-6-phosphate isomerase-like protein (cupin superfamily)